MGGIDTLLYVHETGETAVDSGDHTTYNLYGTDLMNAGDGYSNPIVYKDGVAQGFEVGYSITTDTGDIVFDAAIGAAVVVKCDYTWRIIASLLDDCTVYDFGGGLNMKMSEDINGYVQIVESSRRYASFEGEIEFSYIDITLLNKLLHIAKTSQISFDIQRTSLDAADPYKNIINLMVINKNENTGIPGNPDQYTISFEVRQLDV